ncbi:hypothetical protein [Shinella sp.]|uniref:hypothetical protein n=1 Tax=Shinella sp. TaxID=1870904 RepID=UPI0028AE0104|nr:hypothetical protein [Shinella sp.]
MTEQQTFPGPAYEKLPAGIRPPKSTPLRRALDWVPIHDFMAAHVGFSGRFNRAVKRLEAEGGRALPAAQAHFHFSDALLLSIDPKAVTMRLLDHVVDHGRIRWIGTHFLDGSDWRSILAPVDKSYSHAEIVELCKNRENFRNGPRYKRYAERIAKGETVRRNRIALDTADKLDGYFEYYLALISDIEKNGIVPHSDLGLRGQTGHRHRWTRTFWQDFAERDIGIAIDADGRLVRHTNGKHRMAVALALGLPRIPVEIRLVHARWLQRQSEKLGLPPKDALLATLEDARANGWPAR